MKARHGVILMVISLLVKVAGEVFGILHLPGHTGLWGISSALWTIGLLIVLIKALQSNKLKSFLDE